MRFGIILTVCAAAVVFSSCRKQSVEELLSTAERNYRAAVAVEDSVRAVGDVKALFQPSIDAFEKVVTDYPGTPQAEKALYTLATIRNNDTREPQRAVDAYRRYLAAFPEGPQAPSSLFLIGFIYNNELHNLDSAGAAYREFLQRFPQNEMVSSAQYELDHLGKPEGMIPDTSAVPPPPTGKGEKTALR
jgi:TolA-binding protein